MLIKAVEQITHISDNTDINLENYVESLNFIGDLYRFINKVKLFLNMPEINFEPTFKGYYTCTKYGIPFNSGDGSMRVFVLRSDKLLEDEIVIKIEKEMAEYTTDKIDENTIKFVRKK